MINDHSSPPNPTAGIFRHLRFRCGLLVVIVYRWTAAGVVGEEPTNSAGPLFQEATRQFEGMTSTLYQHKTDVDPKTGRHRYDCVGFVSYALKQAAPEARESAFNALKIKPGRIPTPALYMSFFSSLVGKPQEGWTAVAKASDLRPGDVVAWERITATANGHAVVIAGLPAAGPEGTWIVKVYDSTASPHGDDSRPDDKRAEVLAANGKRSGLGHGVMAFSTDPVTGALTGYRWGPNSKTVVVPIAAGRPTS